MVEDMADEVTRTQHVVGRVIQMANTMVDNLQGEQVVIAHTVVDQTRGEIQQAISGLIQQ